ncbi:DUF6308 family protein [Arthrobacter subterraneus]|nr:DUF6308 family protein [Arthrobacter subterraneus]
MTRLLRVGGRTIDFEQAKEWANTYFVGRPGTSAYPAYDEYPGSPGESIGKQDLLAVVLLNVSNKPLPVYYGLESLIPFLNERLDDPAIHGDLASASTETINAIVHLLNVIEERPTDHVQLTTLSKVLHRKRSALIPLFDDNIAYCYSKCDGAPVPYVKKGTRNRAEYRRLWLEALQRDLAGQFSLWEELAATAPGPSVTPLRALDIIGWELGNRRN